MNRFTTVGVGVAALLALSACNDAPFQPAQESTVSLAKGGNKKGGGRDDEASTGCQISFKLTLHDSYSVRSDTGEPYVDGLDRVQVSTGSGPGFRFDTNGSQHVEHSRDRRHVKFDFTQAELDPAALEPFGLNAENFPGPDEPKGTDLRFIKNEGGLDLCSMEVDQSTAVPVSVTFETQGEVAALVYGATAPSGEACGTQPVTVTREDENSWSMATATEGQACLFYPWFQNNVQTVSMPAAWTVTREP